MTTGELVSWGTVVSIVLMAFLLGMAPVFVVRAISLLYPKDDPRRRELIAEMAHVKGLTKVPEQFRWLGESFATAVCEGIPARRRARKDRRHDHLLRDMNLPWPYETEVIVEIRRSDGSRHTRRTAFGAVLRNEVLNTPPLGPGDQARVSGPDGQSVKIVRGAPAAAARSRAGRHRRG